MKGSRGYAIDTSNRLTVVTAGTTGTGASAQQVQGAAADGAAAAGNPVQVGGVDGAGNAQAILTDTAGKQIVVGGAADAAAASGNSVPIAGKDNSGNIRTPVVSPDGSASAAGANALLVGGWNATGPKIQALQISADNNGTRGLIASMSGLAQTGGATTIYNTPHVQPDAQSFSGVTPNALLVGSFDGTSGRANRSELPTAVMPTTAYRLGVSASNAWLGVQANAWSATAAGVGATSNALDTAGCKRVEAFGNVSGATNISVQLSQDNATWYDATTPAAFAAAGAGNFNLSFDCGARYVRLKTSAAVTVTATIAAKA